VTGTRAATRTRTDPEIFAEARHALDVLPSVPSTIHVHVEGGVATLTGSVQQPAAREQAERAVRQVHGVRRVVNQIVVAPLPSPSGLEAPDV
jgi:osmotically-inducible protein OsmY